MFFQKNVSEHTNPPDELALTCFEEDLRRTNYSSIFSSKVQNLTVFSFIYIMTKIGLTQSFLRCALEFSGFSGFPRFSGSCRARG